MQVKGWKDELQKLIDENNHLKVNGEKAGEKTKQDRAEFFFNFFKLLRSKGYACQPHNIKQKHVKVFCEHMEEKNMSAATIQNYISFLRLFCRWVGKNGMIGDYTQFFKNKEIANRKYVADKDKSWSGNAIDVHQKLLEIKQESVYVWMQLLMLYAFGLRRKEAICFRPNMCVFNGCIHVVDGSKNGKDRVIPVETEFQESAIAEAMRFVGKTSMHLADPKFSLGQNIQKYSRTLAKFKLTKKDLGVTGHGLRAEYAIDFMELFGLIPAVRGGEAGQVEKEKEAEIRLAVSQRLGHNRIGITNAYYGSFAGAGKSKVQKKVQN